MDVNSRLNVIDRSTRVRGRYQAGVLSSMMSSLGPFSVAFEAALRTALLLSKDNDHIFAIRKNNLLTPELL